MSPAFRNFALRIPEGALRILEGPNHAQPVDAFFGVPIKNTVLFVHGSAVLACEALGRLPGKGWRQIYTTIGYY